jgi:hypothetical protein
MMDDYKFQSEITKACLPFGTSHLSEVRREDISATLSGMKVLAANNNWVEMFIICRADGNAAWSEESILRLLSEVRSDIAALKGKLKT